MRAAQSGGVAASDARLFFGAILARVARRLGMSYPALLADLRRALEHGSLPAQPAMRGIVEGLWREAEGEAPGVKRPEDTEDAKLDAVSKGAATEIAVQASERGAVYQLLSGKTAVGAPVPGTGAEILLPTGPIAADTTFSVAAIRADNPQISAVLVAQASVKLKPDA